MNTLPGELVDIFQRRWGENFALGGLAGLPFAGKSGFSAFSHHVPEQGKAFILVAPHVGVEVDGKVGKLQRLNQDAVSTACGAAIGAYNALLKEALATPELAGKYSKETGNDALDELARMGKAARGVGPDAFDAQIAFIKERLRNRLEGINNAADPIAFVTYQMFALVREFIVDEILTAPGVWDDAKEVCVLGGIMVNQADGYGDRFVPLMFQKREEGAGTTVDLFESTFGPRPSLKASLGSATKSREMYEYSLETLSDPSRA